MAASDKEQTMNGYSFEFSGASFRALPSGGLWWPDADLLCVSDLHLGKSSRIARRSGTIMLPPYETEETLSRLDADLALCRPKSVICLGDSFDDDETIGELSEATQLWLLRMQAGRSWYWVEGNHDPGGIAPGGTHRFEIEQDGVIFRHIAERSAVSEISGHYHPKITVSGKAGHTTRPCFVYDNERLILPAYGAYTGGLRATDRAIRSLLGQDARAIMTGTIAVELPIP